MHQPPGQSSPPQAKLCLLWDYLPDPLYCCPWLEPPSQILGKNQQNTFQEASTWLSKSAIQKQTLKDTEKNYK